MQPAASHGHTDFPRDGSGTETRFILSVLKQQFKNVPLT